MLTLTLVAMLGSTPDARARSVSLMTTEALEDERSAMRWRQRSPLFVAVPITMLVGGGCLLVYASFLGYSLSLLNGDTWSHRPEKAPLIGTSIGIMATGFVLMMVGIGLRVSVKERYDAVDAELERRAELPDREIPQAGNRLPAVPNQIAATLLQF